MSISISSVVNRVLRYVGEPLQNTTGAAAGKVTREDCLSYYNKARRKLQRHVNIIKGDERIAAVADQLEYDLPADYKDNLYRVEFNGKPIAKADFGVLDDYDDGWRLSTTRNPKDDEPVYYVPDLKNKNVLIYPPPAADGDSQSLTGYGLPESIELGDDTVTTTDAGFPESIEIAGETFDTNEYGVPEQLISQAGNIRVFYDKLFIDITADEYISFDSQNVDSELEQYLDALEEYMYFQIYSSEIKYNANLAETHLDLFLDEERKIMEEKTKRFHHLKVSPHRKAGYGWGRRAVNSNTQGVFS